MARALLHHERTEAGDWRTVGTFYATPQTLTYKSLPGSASRDAWARGITTGKPPYRDGIGLSLERGTWEDWCDYALDSLSNGHDTWLTEVPPEPTLTATYQKWVLGAPKTLEAETVPTTDAVPELSGYKKVTPS